MKTSFFLSAICLATLPVLSWANTPSSNTTAENVAAAQGAQTATLKQVDNKSVVVSPRTGISYSFSNPEQRPVILKSEEITAVNTATVSRIAASNPALSPQSQLNAQLALVPELAQATPSTAATVTP